MHTRPRPRSPEPSRPGTQSLQRAAALLRELTASNRQGATSADLAARTAIDRTTAHRMLRCLADEGLVLQDGPAKRYFLGPLAYEMGLAASERMDLRALCKPTLLRIAEETGDTAFLMIRSGDDSVCVERAEGTYPIKTFVVDVGTRRPLGVGAGSLAILSALSGDEADGVLTRNVKRYSPFDGLTVKSLRPKMLHARSEGHVTMGVIGVPGVRAVAVPIRTITGRAIAALSVAAVEWRMTKTRQGELLARLRSDAARLGALLDQGATTPSTGN